MRRLRTSLGAMAVAAASVLALGADAHAAGVSYSSASSVYSQDFNGLPTSPENASLQATAPWTDDMEPAAGRTTIPGWYLYHPTQQTEGGTNGHQRMRIGTGSANTGAFWSFGSSGSSDRALGGVGADTLSTPQNADPAPATQEESQMYIGLLLVNNTGQTLNSFNLSYIGEQWRRAGNGPTGAPGTQVTEDGLDFQYSLNPAATISSPNSLYTDVNALDFASPQTTGAAGTINGNDAANRTALSATISDIVWEPGASLWLRWVDTNYPGPNPSAGITRADNGVAVDDLTFSAEAAVPEPGSLAFLGLAALGILRRRR